MCYKRITLSLLILGAALTAAAQTHTDRLPGRELTDVRYDEQRTPLPGSTEQIDSLVQVRTLEQRTYIDTLITVTPREQVTLIPGDSSNRKGHYVEMHIGAGQGNVGYGLISKPLNVPNGSGKEHMALSAVVQLQYAYFFHKNVGIGIGAWFATYGSYSLLQGEWVFSGDGIIDSDGENYVHHATVSNWNERHTIHSVGVPVSLQIQAWGKHNKAGFFMALGAAPTYTVKTNYHVLSGDIEHWGDYPHRNAQMHNKHEFHSINYSNTLGKNQIKQIGATALLDLGLLLRMSPHTDLLLGIYGHYSILDMQGTTLTDIGWKTDEFPNIDMQPYNGTLATNALGSKGSLHPWQAGIKLGVHWHSIEKPSRQTVMHSDTTLQTVARYDSIWTERIDTLERVIYSPTERVQRRIDKLNRIYFRFDSYELSAESKQFLDRIAEQLNTIPNKIILGGHASKEGTRIHNHKLAHNRAVAVRNYLMARGIAAERLLVRDYGSTVPNAINTQGDLSLDRRVEIIVLE